MSRIPRSAAGKPATIVPPIAAIDANAIPAQPDTTPLPSDQISAAAVPVVPAVALDEAAPAETAPLPAPSPAPVDPAPAADDRPALVHVPGTVPLPSDQLTPVARATVEPAERRKASLASDGYGAGRSVDAAGDSPQGAEPSASLDVFDLLRRDLAAAGLDAVVLAPDTADLLRRELDMPGVGAGTDARTFADDEPRRSFAVLFNVEHDGLSVPPGGRVRVTRTDFERLRQNTAISAATEWWDGEDA